jgi:hypothetical protein
MKCACHVYGGVYEGVFPVAGSSVRSMRQVIRQAMNVDPDWRAVVNGVEAGEDHIIPPGATVSFIRGPGHKALGDLLTPVQIRRRWKITEPQYQELCRLGLPTVQLAGEPRHPEEAVDEWFRTRFGRSASAAQAPASTPLRPRERKIVQALAEAGKELKARAIANRADLPDNSNFRTILSNLVSRGVLNKGVNGYSLAPGVLPSE